MYALLITALVASLALRYYVKRSHPKGLNKINEENEFMNLTIEEKNDNK